MMKQHNNLQILYNNKHQMFKNVNKNGLKRLAINYYK